MRGRQDAVDRRGVCVCATLARRFKLHLIMQVAAQLRIPESGCSYIMSLARTASNEDQHRAIHRLALWIRAVHSFLIRTANALKVMASTGRPRLLVVDLQWSLSYQ